MQFSILGGGVRKRNASAGMCFVVDDSKHYLGEKLLNGLQLSVDAESKCPSERIEDSLKQLIDG